MIKTIEVKVPDEVYIEAGLALYDKYQLMAALERLDVKPEEYRSYYALQYAKAQIEGARTDG